MALPSTTITATRPALLNAGDNPIIVGLSTNSIGSAGYARARIKVLSTNTNNLTLTFTLTGGTIYNKVFTGKQYPNRDDYFLTGTLKDGDGNTVTTGITTSQIASSIAGCLKKDTIITTDYYVNYSGSTIVELMAKEPGTIYSLAGQVVSSNGSNVSFTSISTGSNQYSASLIPDYQLYVEVYKGRDGLELGQATNTTNYDRVTELVLPFSSDNVHHFDVSTICKSFVSTPAPDLVTTGATVITTYVKPFAFAYGEQYPLVPGTNTIKKLQKGILNHVYVANASLPFTIANNMSAYSGLTSNSLTMFLTNQPTTKRTSRNQKELLYILIPKDIGGSGFRIYSQVKYWDGTTTAGFLYYLFTGVTNTGGVYRLNMSYESNFAQWEANGKKIKTVSVQILNSGVITYSAKQTYQFGIEDIENRYGISFKNSLGCYDTFDFHGVHEDNIDRTTKTLTSPLSINQNGSISEGSKYSSNYDTQVNKVVNANSGWINEEHFNWLIDLMKSNEIYHYNNEGTIEFIKLDSFKYQKNNQTNQYFIEAGFINSIPENNVSE